MRKITLTIEDEETKHKLSADTNIDHINELWDKHQIFGLGELLVLLNNQLNDISGNKVNLVFGSQINDLPEGKLW